MEVAGRMKDFEAGIFQILNEKKLEVEREGKKVYNFSVGTPDFAPAEHIMHAVALAASKPENYKYSLIDIPELVQAVIDRYRMRYGVELTKNELMSVYGSQEGIAHICMALVDPGEIVLVPNPGYPIFSIGPQLAGARVLPYELTPERGYLPDLEAIERAYGAHSETGEHAKVMIVSYPLNPVCRIAPDSFYEALIPWACRNHILIIHDNAYSDIVYDGRVGRSFLSYEGAKEVGVEFYSLSKSYNYTGARMSFLVGNETVVSAFRKLRSQIDYGIFLPVQYGAIAALTQSDDQVKAQCAEYEARRNALCDGFTEIGWPIERSEGSMFVWAKLPNGRTDDETFVLELLKKAGIVCTPGSSFGSLGKGYVRFALVLPVPEIQEAIAIVKESGILH